MKNKDEGRNRPIDDSVEANFRKTRPSNFGRIDESSKPIELKISNGAVGGKEGKKGKRIFLITLAAH